MRRTPLRRSTPMPPASSILERRTRLAASSSRRRKVNQRRAELAHAYLGALCRIRTDVCTRDAEHWHELVSRAQGGSLVDPRGLVPACDACNSYIEDFPALAYERGWKVRRVDAMPGIEGLVPKVPNPLAIAWDADCPTDREEWK